MQMTHETQEAKDLMRARAIGGLTALVVAIVTGGVLLVAGQPSKGLVASIIGATFVVAAFAFRAGRVAGQKIAPGGWLAALAIGTLGGATTLVVAAVTAALVGALWSLGDGGHDSQLFYSYLIKPFLAVLGYGFIVAILLGAVTGLIIRGLIGRARR